MTVQEPTAPYISPSSNLSGQVKEIPATKNCTGPGYSVAGSEELRYTYSFVDNVFDEKKQDLASHYKKWGRVLVIIDETVHGHYGDSIRTYFNTYDIKPTLHVFKGGELNKNMDTMLEFVDAMDNFGLIRKEPVLVVGGGLASDVAGYACASYRRSTNYIRVGTTLIALIDAAISIKVGINHKKLKNRLGAYHAPMHTFLDFDFLKTLPEGQTRNGFAEIMKISHCAEKPTWDLLVKYGPQLVKTGFGRKENGGSKELKDAADEICRRAILKMLQLESGNLHEIGLDRVIASGHGISPTLELAPFPPLRHGHAITVDMSYTITMSHARGLLTDEERDEWFTLANGVGLTVDHEKLDNELLHDSIAAIMKTRDGSQRFVLAGPYGKCMFANDITKEEFESVLATHKAYVKERFPQYPGSGQDAYADAGDLGADPEAIKADKLKATNGSNGTNGHSHSNGNGANGLTNGNGNGHVSVHNASSRHRHKPTALVNGGRMQKSIFVARALSQKGYRVVLVEEKGWDIFVPCSGAGTTIEDAKVAHLIREVSKGKVQALIQSPALVEALHNKDQFLQLVTELELDAPQSHLIKTPKEAMALFSQPGQSPMILKAATILDDVGRSDLTTFPLLTRQGQPDWKRTEARLKTGLYIPMTPSTPYAAQEFIGGYQASEWCTHATVHRGRITAFVCCPSNDMLMTYHNVTHSVIGRRALRWTETFLARLSKHADWKDTTLTGQFSMDFIHQPSSDRLVVIECNPRVHTAIGLLTGSSEVDEELAGALDGSRTSTTPLTPHIGVPSMSWWGHDLIARKIPGYFFVPDGILHLLHPLWSKVKSSEGHPFYNLEAIGRDAAWDRRDPFVFFALYHIQIPALLLRQLLLRRKPYSRINISTSRIFEC
ncbi:hypothetical protein CBS101457_000835 [Exobasidium rhododendri]|nr:hypothetical protein CBS101457_000835 [Exobasidium rhododendri]